MIKKFVLWYLRNKTLTGRLELPLPWVIVNLTTHSVHRLHHETRKGKLPGTRKRRKAELAADI